MWLIDVKNRWHFLLDPSWLGLQRRAPEVWDILWFGEGLQTCSKRDARSHWLRRRLYVLLCLFPLSLIGQQLLWWKKTLSQLLPVNQGKIWGNICVSSPGLYLCWWPLLKGLAAGCSSRPAGCNELVGSGSTEFAPQPGSGRRRLDSQSWCCSSVSTAEGWEQDWEIRWVFKCIGVF